MDNRIQFGMWKGLDVDNWKKYSSNLIKGIEISQIKNENELKLIKEFCTKNDLEYGFHTPVLINHEYPMFTSAIKSRREYKSRVIEDLQLADKYGADYMLFHFPYPAIFPNNLNNNIYHQIMLYEEFEHYFSKNYSILEFQSITIDAIEFLIEVSKHFKTKIVLENEFIGDFEDVYVEAIGESNNIYLAIDTQRLDIYKKVSDHRFDPYTFIKNVGKKVYVVHYSNVHYEKLKFTTHIPALSEQGSGNSHGDAFCYLKYLLELNGHIHITLEHNPTLVPEDKLKTCYLEVERLLKGGD